MSTQSSVTQKKEKETKAKEQWVSKKPNPGGESKGETRTRKEVAKAVGEKKLSFS